MQTDQLYDWEKWPLMAAFAAQGTYVFRWYLGDQIVPEFVGNALPMIHTLGAFAAALSIEGAMIATIMGMRAGRRSPASTLALVVTATFGAAVALNLYGALGTDVGAWLHAGFALTIVSYLLHLAQPLSQPAPTPPTKPSWRVRVGERIAQWLAKPTPPQQAPVLPTEVYARPAALPEPVPSVAPQAWHGEARRLKGEGVSARQIAQQLNLSPSTVTRYLNSLEEAND